MSTAIAPTETRAEAKARFDRAALWHAADPSCGEAYDEFMEAYAALSALARADLPGALARITARRQAQEAA